jgi:hypothetical protein
MVYAIRLHGEKVAVFVPHYSIAVQNLLGLPGFPPVWNSQLVHPRPESIWVKSQDLGSSSWPVDLATGHLQSLPDMLGIDLFQRKHGPISARLPSHFTTYWNPRGRKRLK